MSILYQFAFLLFIILISCIAITQVTKRTTIEGLTAECNNTKGKYENVEKKIKDLQYKLKYGPLTKQLNEGEKIPGEMKNKLDDLQDYVDKTFKIMQNLDKQSKKCK